MRLIDIEEFIKKARPVEAIFIMETLIDHHRHLLQTFHDLMKEHLDEEGYYED
jgi:hypothetical protein